MRPDTVNTERVIDKIRQLPQERLAEVEDFVDFLTQRAAEREAVAAVARAAEPAFAAVWDNPDDAAYDRL